MFWGKKKSEKRTLLEPFDLSEEVEDYLIGCMNERTIAAGEVVVSEGDPGDSLYVIASGTLLVFKRNSVGEQVAVAKMEAGDFFGEMSLFMNKQRSATVIASEDSRLFEILNKRSIEYLISNVPTLQSELKKAFLLRRHNDRTKLRHDMGDDI